MQDFIDQNLDLKTQAPKQTWASKRTLPIRTRFNVAYSARSANVFDITACADGGDRVQVGTVTRHKIPSPLPYGPQIVWLYAFQPNEKAARRVGYRAAFAGRMADIKHVVDAMVARAGVPS